MNIRIRTSRYGRKIIKLCPHIAIDEYETKEKDSEAEYIENLFIHCRICKRYHKVTILVN